MAPNGTESGEIMRNNGHYTIQGHTRSPILVPMKSPYVWIIVPYLLSCNNSNILQITGQIFYADTDAKSWTNRRWSS